MAGNKVPEQVYLPNEWRDAQPELVRKQFELARALNPLIDGRVWNARTMTSAGTMNAADGVILADASAGAFTITAIDAGDAINKTIMVKKIDSSVNKVMILRAGTNTIEGVTITTLAAQYDNVVLFSSGAATWWRF